MRIWALVNVFSEEFELVNVTDRLVRRNWGDHPMWNRLSQAQFCKQTVPGMLISCAKGGWCTCLQCILWLDRKNFCNYSRRAAGSVPEQVQHTYFEVREYDFLSPQGVISCQAIIADRNFCPRYVLSRYVLRQNNITGMKFGCKIFSARWFFMSKDKNVLDSYRQTGFVLIFWNVSTVK